MSAVCTGWKLQMVFVTEESLEGAVLFEWWHDLAHGPPSLSTHTFCESTDGGMGVNLRNRKMSHENIIFLYQSHRSSYSPPLSASFSHIHTRWVRKIELNEYYPKSPITLQGFYFTFSATKKGKTENADAYCCSIDRWTIETVSEDCKAWKGSGL